MIAPEERRAAMRPRIAARGGWRESWASTLLRIRRVKPRSPARSAMPGSVDPGQGRYRHTAAGRIAAGCRGRLLRAGYANSSGARHPSCAGAPSPRPAGCTPEGSASTRKRSRSSRPSPSGDTIGVATATLSDGSAAACPRIIAATARRRRAESRGRGGSRPRTERARASRFCCREGRHAGPRPSRGDRTRRGSSPPA